MSLEVARGLAEAVDVRVRGPLAFKLKKLSEEAATALVAALDGESKLDGYSPKEWGAMKDVYLTVLERVTASIPLEKGPQISTSWNMGRIHEGLAALPSVQASGFARALQGHAEAVQQVDALVTGRGVVCPSLKSTLPKGEPLNAILSVLRAGRVVQE